MNIKENFAYATNELTVGIAHQMLTACENYGMTWGCDTECPVLRDGLCEHQDTECKELWEEIQEENK